MAVYVKYKCKRKTNVQTATTETIRRRSYNEHAAMHYDTSGWSEWTETYYNVNKCKVCGHSHSFTFGELIALSSKKL